MKLVSGVRLGPYEIVEPIGAGGMGEVYRAIDTRLGRTVAIKILPADFARDAKLKIRFDREAKTISSLNHPHICALFDVGPDYLVMEHCEGKTLARRIADGPLPLEQVLEYGIQIAGALDNAHRQGIVHRDLKPSNIMLTKSGVKLLDFGLAKQNADSWPDESTMQKVTEEGKILGTIQYMAPELLHGKDADARSDIFALGLVLYEMVIGRPGFSGTSKASLIAAILEHEPKPIAELKPASPPAFDRLIRACLTKDPEDRSQTAHDVKLNLQSIVASLGEKPPRNRLGWRSAITALVMLLIGSTVLMLNPWRMPRRSLKEAPALRPTFVRLTDEAGVETSPTLSPDGKFVAYVSSRKGRAGIHLLRIGGSNTIDLTATSTADDSEPAFSPDGQEIAFRSEREGGGIFVMGATGESVRRISDFGFNPSWSPDGEELAVSSIRGDLLRSPDRGEIWRIGVANGQKRRVTSASEGDAVQPGWSPHGQRIAFCTGRYLTRRGQIDIVTVSANGGNAVRVTNDSWLDWNPVWSPEGDYLYFSSNRGGSMNLWRVAIDEQTGTVKREPEPVTTPASWSGPLSIAGNGRRIAFCARDRRGSIERISLDPREPKVVGTPVPIAHSTMVINQVSVSPDGEWLVFTDFLHEGLYVIRRDGSALRKLTGNALNQLNWYPHWSPDGKRIAFHAARNGMAQAWIVHSDGSRLQQVTQLGCGVTAPQWSPDAARMVVAPGRCSKSGTCIVDLNGPLPTTKCDEVSVFEDGWRTALEQWSPDGKWLAGTVYRSNVETRLVVYSVEARKYDVLGNVSGFVTPLWMSDNRRLLFIDDDKIRVVDRSTLKMRSIFDPGSPLNGSLSLTKDERTLYYIRSSNEADIWLMEMQ